MVETVIERTKVTLTGKGVSDLSDPLLNIFVDTLIEIDPTTARRKATAWLVSEVGNLIKGGTPSLHIARRTVWRVPALLTSPSKGLRGQVGFVDVDAETGEMLIHAELRNEILLNVKSIANTDSTLSTNP